MVFQSQLSYFYPPAAQPPSLASSPPSGEELFRNSNIDKSGFKTGSDTVWPQTLGLLGQGVVSVSRVPASSGTAFAPSSWTKHYTIDQSRSSPNNIRKCAIEAYPANGSFIGNSPPRKYTINDIAASKILEESTSEEEGSSLTSFGKSYSCQSLQLQQSQNCDNSLSGADKCDSNKPMSTTSRARRRQNAGRFRTMPITLDEIREVEAEDESSSGHETGSLKINSARSYDESSKFSSHRSPDCVRKFSDSDLHSSKISRSKAALSASAAFRRNRSLSLPNGQLFRGDQGKLHFRFNDHDSLPPIPEEKQHPDKCPLNNIASSTTPRTRSISEQQCDSDFGCEGCASLYYNSEQFDSDSI